VRSLLERGTVQVDLQDEQKDTALHVAARCGQHEILQLLLSAGADLGQPNLAGETPMALLGNIPPDITEEILDSCITAEREGSTLAVTLTYPFLGPPREPGLVDSEKGEGGTEEMAMTKTKAEDATEEPAKAVPETSSLLFLIESAEHEHLLEHPVINSFLRLKFATIAPYYIIKCLCYAVLIAFINAYVFLLNKHIMETGVPEETSAELGVKWITILKLAFLGLRVLMFLVPCSVFLVRKLMSRLASLRADHQDQEQEQVQRAPNPNEDVTNIEQWLLVSIFLSTSLLATLPWEVATVRHLSATTILASWFGFLFHIGFHPSFGIYRNMFVTVSKNFVNFLSWFIFFILAFALCFFFLFSMPGTELNPAFATVELTLEKTIVMVFTGEIDYGGLVFTHEFGKFIFVLFIFFVMLVIMNLLNGLAISDIGVIQEESARIMQKNRMIYIVAYEEFLINGSAFVRSLGGFKMVAESLTNREARFHQKGKHWTCKDVQMPPEVLDLLKVHAVNKALAEAEEKAKKAEEEGPGIKEVQERLARIERVLETLTENIAKLK